jgi:phosphorylcholine metabolism protein LicD
MSRPIHLETTFDNPRNYELAKNGLIQAVPVLDGFGLPWWLHGGTLLGCVKLHDFVPVDDDGLEHVYDAGASR